MIQITANMVASLRSSTGLGIMDCKKALQESQGDVNKALELLRIKSGVKAGKLANRIAGDGIVFICMNDDNSKGSIVEINCETDFVANDSNFKQFVKNVANLIIESQINDLKNLNNLKLSNGKTLEEYRQEVIAKLGENICIRRFKYLSTDYRLDYYLHGNRIGVIVEYEGQSKVARDVCMHIAASKPLSVSKDDIDFSIIEKEKHIYTEQAKQSGKPIEIINKMVEGKVNKFLTDITLLGQNFIKNPDITIEKFLAENDTKILSFIIFEVGEGIEKKSVDYAEEVASVVNRV